MQLDSLGYYSCEMYVDLGFLVQNIVPKKIVRNTKLDQIK